MSKIWTKLVIVAWAFAALWLAGAAHANVSLRNGNFFMGYTDIIYPGGFEPKIDRVYNSKTSFKGMFGWGWGNEYEVQLKVVADGSVTVHEYGGGAENRFVSPKFNEAELNKAVDQLTNVARAAGVLSSPQALAQYKIKVKTDAAYRNDEWEKWRAQGKVAERKLPVGTQLVSNRFSFQYVTVREDGYVRTFDTGRNEFFTAQGKLRRIQDKNNNFINLEYGADGKLAKIIDNFNRKIFLTFNNRGLVEKIQGENNKTSTYSYNSFDELASSKDVDGNSYQYKYSPDRRHNMTEIAYGDKTSLQIAYWGRDKNENVKMVKDRDGAQTEYDYWSNPSDKGNTSVTVKVKGDNGKIVSSSKYEYFLKRKADGEEFTQRMVTDLDGDRTDTVYNESGLPLSIKKGSDLTTFAYDVKGRVLKKVTPVEITELSYDKGSGKVARVSRMSKSDKRSLGWSQFTYDSKGNLASAQNSQGKKVRLVYDMNGRVKTMVDQSNRALEFKYNENSKPIEIRDPKVGAITVSYANSGQVKNIDSTGGRNVASQVKQSFQNLLEILKPAGVTLSF